VLAALAAAALGVPLVKGLKGAGRTRQLEMLEGPDPGEVFELKTEKTSLGAIAPEADVVITDPFRKISRRHCEIVRSNGRYFLTDCSTNGTTINGKAAPRGEPVLLRKGDRIALADDVVLRFK
jgi:predicted component of type VI protein secretion system